MPEYWDDHGWGFGVAVVTRRHDLTGVGTYGWDGGLGTSWRNDPSEEMIDRPAHAGGVHVAGPAAGARRLPERGVPGHRRLTIPDRRGYFS